MGEAERRNATINGVINVGRNGGIINIVTIKNDLITQYEKTPDQLGKIKTVEFEETKTESGQHYVNYWVY
jgi:hypothetical protein